MRQSRCIRYAHTGDQRVAELRGLMVFDAMRRGFAVRRLFGGHGRVHIGSQVRSGCPDELVFMLMPSHALLAEYVAWHANQPGRAVVVDVHADVLALLEDPAPEMGVSLDGRGDDEAWGWWSDTHRQQALRRSVAAATVVTTPWPQLVAPLRAINPNVELLPDVDPDDPGRFVADFARVAAKAASLSR